MMTPGETIAARRRRAGMTQQELAAALEDYSIHVKKSAVCAWENGVSQPSVSQFLALCRLFRITDVYSEFIGPNPDSPFAGLNEAGREKALEYIRLLHCCSDFCLPEAPVVSLPAERDIRVYYLPVSAGTGSFLDSDDYESISVGPEVPARADFGVRVSGDSMQPRFVHGQVVWIQQTPELSDGEIGIFYLNGKAYIKKLQIRPGGIALISLNPAYDPILPGTNDEFSIFGRVVA